MAKGMIYIESADRETRFRISPLGCVQLEERLTFSGNWQRAPRHREPDAAMIVEALRDAYDLVGKALENWLREESEKG